jgi:hypothetical protein
MKDHDISELKELLDNFKNYWDEDTSDREDFFNEYEHYMNLSDSEILEAIEEAIDIKIKSFDPKIRAAAEYFECEPDEVEEESYDHYGLEVYSYDHDEVAVGDDDEATDAATEEIKGSLWAFNASFISSHTKNGLSSRAEDALEKMQGELCEDANDIVEALIEDIDEFVQDAISEDSRGHFLASYDDEENEIKIDDEYYYVYRIN